MMRHLNPTWKKARGKQKKEQRKQENKEEPPFALILSEGWSESPYRRPK